MIFKPCLQEHRKWIRFWKWGELTYIIISYYTHVHHKTNIWHKSSGHNSSAEHKLRKLHDLMPWTCFDNMTLTSLSTPCLVYYAAIRVSRDREPGPVINACLWCAVNLQCVSRELVTAPNKIWYYISRDCMLFVYFITISINMLLHIFTLLLRCIPEPVLFCEM